MGDRARRLRLAHGAGCTPLVVCGRHGGAAVRTAVHRVSGRLEGHSFGVLHGNTERRKSLLPGHVVGLEQHRVVEVGAQVRVREIDVGRSAHADPLGVQMPGTERDAVDRGDPHIAWRREQGR